MTRILATTLAALLVGGIASAQTPGPFGGFKHDRSCPIEITANALEVRQAESLAVFSGDVVAGQCTLRLTADVIEVRYSEEGSNDSETGAINNLQANGNVFLTNGSETAQGAWAEYDVDTGMVRMGGDVVLTQGENVISGETLVINLDVGQGRIEGAGSGRVKTIFTPSQASEGQAGSAEASPTEPVCTPEQEAAAAAAGLKCVPADASN
ncbi:MAG: LptA/OstA family protein [Pseudomonadota bacterium]